MEKELLKINVLTIAGTGLLMLLAGLLLYPFRAAVAQHMRFWLPIPPLGVAAYVFVFNIFKHHNGEIPDDRWVTLKEVATGSAVAALVFGVFSLLLIVLANSVRRSL